MKVNLFLGTDKNHVFGPVTIPIKLGRITECATGPDRWAYFAEELVKQIYHVNFSDYNHHIFLLPDSSVIQRDV